MRNLTQARYKALMACLLVASVLPVSAHAAPDTSFGRLFSTPSERNQLSELRRNQQQKMMVDNKVQQTSLSTAQTTITLPAPITLQGYVKRSDGANTLWINNQAVQENSMIDRVKIGKLNQRGYSKKGASTEGIDVKIPANGKQVRLKAGQMYAPENNKIYEMQVIEKAKRLRLEESGAYEDIAASHEAPFYTKD